MKKLLFFAALIWALGVKTTPVLAQCTVGYTYAKLKENFDSKSNLVKWADKVDDDGTPYVIYNEKEEYITYASYLKDGIVIEYTLFGSAKGHANFWGEYADQNFSRQGHNVWIDYARNIKWTLRIRDGETATFSAVRNDD